MKTPIKVALLSALVIPGAGHFHLKRYKSAVILIGSSLAGLYYIISNVVEKSLQIVEQIQTGAIQLNDSTITTLLTQHTGAAETQRLDIATAVLLICWLVGIIDSYRAAHAQGKNKTGA
ncbi:MAG: hypothetical protein H8E21_05540 [Gammaproteobacteria bacterium]|nr:hypothetical protein [Gammaproteobacteria bacterium]MBL6999718.1 hypothetical protein [Gammaproteobacteria bacterium]